MEQLQGYLSSIIDAMPSVLIGIDEDGVVTQWNQEAERVSCKSAADALGKELITVFPGLTTEMEMAKKAMREGVPQTLQKYANSEQGQVRFVDIAVYPLDHDDKKGAVIRWDDVTEQTRIEEIMVQSEKMLSLGGLAAGMAHEINNPLAGIMQNAQVLRNRIKPGLPSNVAAAKGCGTEMPVIQQYMEERKIPLIIESIIESGKRASKLVDNMLSFSRKGAGRKAAESLPGLIDKTIELVMNDYDLTKRFDFRKIQIIRDLDPDVPEVLCEASKIQQVILNILKNGAQAMSEAGITEPVFILRLHKVHDQVLLEISDNGPGMNEAIKKRVFEPFFTTKSAGTGLGLSVAYFIVTEDHNGSLSVDSHPGKGTHFILSLPVNGEGTQAQGEMV
jgi:PAS domain S-box-containing protein